MCLLPAVANVVHDPGNPVCTVLDVPVRNVVLLAEDNDCVAGLVGRIVARIGLRLLRVETGARCEQLFAERQGEIVLAMLDCRLPDADGAALGVRLQSRVPALPLLLMSGREHAQSSALVAEGRAEFLAKPFFPTQVEERIAALLGAIA